MRRLVLFAILVSCQSDPTPRPTAVASEPNAAIGASDRPTTKSEKNAPDLLLLRMVREAEALRAEKPNSARVLFERAAELFDDLNAESKLTQRGRDAGAQAQFRMFEYDAEERLSTLATMTPEELVRARDEIVDGAKWVRSYNQPKWSAKADVLEQKVLERFPKF